MIFLSTFLIMVIICRLKFDAKFDEVVTHEKADQIFIYKRFKEKLRQGLCCRDDDYNIINEVDDITEKEK